MNKIYTAAIIIIGNEILSGRTKDKNLGWLAEQLNARGIRLMEGRVIPDIEEEIVDAVNTCRAKFDYVFTTGGIGPTHDDITSMCVAKAFGTRLERNPEAQRMLEGHYKPEDLNEARLTMADIPAGATLVPNPVSAAPGYRIENVYVLAGVPNIMQAMFEHLKHELQGGEPVRSHAIAVDLPEGKVAHGVTELQSTYPQVEIGSYPFIKDGVLSTSIVMRTPDIALLKQVSDEMRGFLQAEGGKIVEEIAD